MFHGWDNFYFMLGSAAAGLIGLLFVVITLTSELDQNRIQRGQALYMTPTALHFAIVLTTGAATMAPGLSRLETAALLGLIALVGLANAARALVGIAQPADTPAAAHWSDIWTYGVAPVAIYLGLCGSAAAVGFGAAWATYAVAGSVLALLLLAIRNAWDLVTWIAPRRGSL